MHTVLNHLRLFLAKKLDLIPPNKWAILWVVEFPLFEYDEDSKRFVAAHHPFTSPRPEDVVIQKEKPSANVQTYVQHSLLDYIGLRIFLDHPAVGVGWQGSTEESAYGPQLPAAHKRFPNAPALAFPSPQHAWGVQNAYLGADTSVLEVVA